MNPLIQPPSRPDACYGSSTERLKLSISRLLFSAKGDAGDEPALGRARRRTGAPTARRPERRLGLVEAIGNAAARAVRRSHPIWVHRPSALPAGAASITPAHPTSRGNAAIASSRV